MQKRCYTCGIIMLLPALLVLSCGRTEKVVPAAAAYDVILVIGQSNTFQGTGIDPSFDAADDRIRQLGRWNRNNLKIILATEPLDNLSMHQNTIGFSMTFAKMFKNKYLQTGRQVLIIPGGMGGTGFCSGYWNVGDTLYADAVMRTRYVLKNFKSDLVAILWLQGESDISNLHYQQSLDSMIVNIRNDITGRNDIPFILGGMVPWWVSQDTNRIILSDIIEKTVGRIKCTGYANPLIPYVIEKSDRDYDPVHYDGQGMRELGRRYFSEYEKIVEGTSRIAFSKRISGLGN